MIADPFIAQLADLCRAHPTRAKWVFVPTYAVGATLGERLTREGTDWVNLRFVTPLDVAISIALPFVFEQGFSPADEELGPAMALEMLRRLPADVPAYFRQLPAHPLLGNALWASLRELRLAGMTATSLPASAFGAAADKYAELQALLAEYESFLDRERLVDPAAIYREAQRHLGWSPIAPEDVSIEYPDVIWPPLARALLDALPGARLAPAVPGLPGVAVPRRLQVLPRVVSERSSPLAWLKEPGSLPQTLVPPPESFVLFKADGRDAEIETVLRSVLSAPAGPARLDAVEIVCPSESDAWHVWLKAARYGLPVTMADGVALESARPARALLAWCRWVEEGFPASGLRRMLQSGDVVLELTGGLGPGQAGRLLLKSEATWGRRAYTIALDGLADRNRRMAAGPETDENARAYALTRAAQAEVLRAWIDRVIAAVPEPAAADGGGARALVVDSGRVWQAALAFLRDHARVSDKLDGAARAACEAALTRLSTQALGLRPLADLMAQLRAALVGRRVCAESAKPGSLHVAPIERAGLSGRPLTFVVGLEEGAVFPQPFEDPVLLDHEREGLHPMLPRSQDRVDEAVHTVLSRLAVLPCTTPPSDAASVPAPAVWFSYSSRDLRENRPTLPSWLMLHAHRLTCPGESVSFEHLDARLGEPLSVVPGAPGDALADAGWWLANLKRAGPAGRDAVKRAFPSLAQGAVAEAARKGDVLTPYDGFVPAAGAALDPRQSGAAVSATALELLGECPFRFFLERGLQLEPVDDNDEDDDIWLDALTYGSLMHDLYADVMREARRRGARATIEAFGPWLRERAETALGALRERMPPLSEHVFDAERDRVVRDAETFLRLEEAAASAGRIPVAFEVAFGYRPDAAGDRDEVLAVTDPVALPVGGATVRFCGRIDRIDALPDGTFQVTDYKTGRLFTKKFRGTFSRGRLFQHAVYGLVAERLLVRTTPAARVSSGRYYFPTSKGEGLEHAVSRPTDGVIDEVLSALLDVAKGGVFLAAPVNESDRRKDGDPCRFCDVRAACGHDATGRAVAKCENAANESLEPLRRLRDAE